MDLELWRPRGDRRVQGELGVRKHFLTLGQNASFLVRTTSWPSLASLSRTSRAQTPLSSHPPPRRCRPQRARPAFPAFLEAAFGVLSRFYTPCCSLGLECPPQLLLRPQSKCCCFWGAFLLPPNPSAMLPPHLNTGTRSQLWSHPTRGLLSWPPSLPGQRVLWSGALRVAPSRARHQGAPHAY